MYTTQITLKGTSLEELEMGIEQVKRKIARGYLSGEELRADDVASYSFRVQVDKATWECTTCGHYNHITNEEETIDQDSLCLNCNSKKGL